MHKAPTLIGVAVLILTAAACETVDPETYQKFSVDHAYVSGPTYNVRLNTRRGVTQGFQGWIPADAKAVVLWFPGGEGLGGTMGLDGVLNFNDIGFVTVPPPSDWPRGFVCCGRPFRSTTLHLRDVAAVIGYLREKTDLPIWLIGLSMGTVSIANVATRLPDAIDGVVFLSSITNYTAGGHRARGETMVTQMALSRIKVPVLAVAHAQDNDPTTPPRGARTIVRRATNAPVKEMKIFSEGPDVKPYGGGYGRVPHSFAGSGHSSFDVRFSPDYVCLALNSGRSGGIAEGPFLTRSGHLTSLSQFNLITLRQMLPWSGTSPMAQPILRRIQYAPTRVLPG